MKPTERIKIIKLLISLIFFVCFSCSSYTSNFQSAFDRFDNLLNKGLGYSKFNNLHGQLAWGESHIMEAYMVMYRVSNDSKYLKKLIQHAENVLQQRDDKQGRTNYRGISGPTWVANKYSINKQPYAWIVHSGMITYPMADFAQLVIHTPGLQKELSFNGQSFIFVAKKLIEEIRATIAAHDDQWDFDQKVYCFRNTTVINHPLKVLPHNMYAAMGRTLLMMYIATGEAEYLRKVTGMAKYFYGHLIYNPSNMSYTWMYGLDGSTEDISHGAIETNFAFLCYRHGVIFGHKDMERFASTFKNMIYKKPLHFSEYVDGSGILNKHLNAVGLWLPLSLFDKDIYHSIAEVFSELFLKKTTNEGIIMTGIANCALYRIFMESVASSAYSIPAPYTNFIYMIKPPCR